MKFGLNDLKNLILEAIDEQEEGVPPEKIIEAIRQIIKLSGQKKLNRELFNQQFAIVTKENLKDSLKANMADQGSASDAIRYIDDQMKKILEAWKSAKKETTGEEAHLKYDIQTNIKNALSEYVTGKKYAVVESKAKRTNLIVATYRLAEFIANLAYTESKTKLKSIDLEEGSANDLIKSLASSAFKETLQLPEDSEIKNLDTHIDTAIEDEISRMKRTDSWTYTVHKKKETLEQAADRVLFAIKDNPTAKEEIKKGILNQSNEFITGDKVSGKATGEELEQNNRILNNVKELIQQSKDEDEKGKKEQSIAGLVNTIETTLELDDFISSVYKLALLSNEIDPKSQDAKDKRDALFNEEVDDTRVLPYKYLKEFEKLGVEDKISRYTELESIFDHFAAQSAPKKSTQDGNEPENQPPIFKNNIASRPQLFGINDQDEIELWRKTLKDEERKEKAEISTQDSTLLTDKQKQQMVANEFESNKNNISELIQAYGDHVRALKQSFENFQSSDNQPQTLQLLLVEPNDSAGVTGEDIQQLGQAIEFYAKDPETKLASFFRQLRRQHSYSNQKDVDTSKAAFYKKITEKTFLKITGDYPGFYNPDSVIEAEFTAMLGVEKLLKILQNYKNSPAEFEDALKKFTDETGEETGEEKTGFAKFVPKALSPSRNKKQKVSSFIKQVLKVEKEAILKGYLEKMDDGSYIIDGYGPFPSIKDWSLGGVTEDKAKHKQFLEEYQQRHNVADDSEKQEIQAKFNALLKFMIRCYKLGQLAQAGAFESLFGAGKIAKFFDKYAQIDESLDKKRVKAAIAYSEILKEQLQQMPKSLSPKAKKVLFEIKKSGLEKEVMIILK